MVALGRLAAAEVAQREAIAAAQTAEAATVAMAARRKCVVHGFGMLWPKRTYQNKMKIAFQKNHGSLKQQLTPTVVYIYIYSTKIRFIPFSYIYICIYI